MHKCGKGKNPKGKNSFTKEIDVCKLRKQLTFSFSENESNPTIISCEQAD